MALSNLTSVVKASHTRAILTFLHHCKKTHAPVTVALIKQWLEEYESAAHGPAHLALRWFFRSAPNADSVIKNSVERRETRIAPMPANGLQVIFRPDVCAESASDRVIRVYSCDS